MTRPFAFFKVEQQEICRKYGSQFVETPAEGRIGIALKTMRTLPLNGLRHPPHGNMLGWYLWGGELGSDRNSSMSFTPST